MTRKLPPLKAIQAFEAASRLGSFAAASHELSLTPSAISHQIRELEQRLGITLFHRVNRTVVLTDAGRRYAEAVAEGFGVIEAGTRSIERANKSDILTVHTVPSLGMQWLMPRLSRFSAMHDDIDLRLNASVGPVDLGTGEADFDIRYGTIFPAAGVVAVPFPEEAVVVLCAPALAQKKPAIHRFGDLSAHTLIHSEVNLYSWRDWMRDHPAVDLQIERGPRFDRSFMAISAARDGIGIALESKLLIERELEAGNLVLPFGDDGPRLICHQLLYLRSKSHLPKIKAFRDWLFEQLALSEPPR